jgi:hypothetical protein
VQAMQRETFDLSCRFRASQLSNELARNFVNVVVHK